MPRDNLILQSAQGRNSTYSQHNSMYNSSSSTSESHYKRVRVDGSTVRIPLIGDMFKAKSQEGLDALLTAAQQKADSFGYNVGNLKGQFLNEGTLGYGSQEHIYSTDPQSVTAFLSEVFWLSGKEKSLPITASFDDAGNLKLTVAAKRVSSSAGTETANMGVYFNNPDNYNEITMFDQADEDYGLDEDIGHLQSFMKNLFYSQNSESSYYGSRGGSGSSHSTIDAGEDTLRNFMANYFEHLTHKVESDPENADEYRKKFEIALTALQLALPDETKFVDSIMRTVRTNLDNPSSVPGIMPDMVDGENVALETSVTHHGIVSQTLTMNKEKLDNIGDNKKTDVAKLNALIDTLKEMYYNEKVNPDGSNMTKAQEEALEEQFGHQIERDFVESTATASNGGIDDFVNALSAGAKYLGLEVPGVDFEDKDALKEIFVDKRSGKITFDHIERIVEERIAAAQKEQESRPTQERKVGETIMVSTRSLQTSTGSGGSSRTQADTVEADDTQTEESTSQNPIFANPQTDIGRALAAEYKDKDLSDELQQVLAALMKNEKRANSFFKDADFLKNIGPKKTVALFAGTVIDDLPKMNAEQVKQLIAQISILRLED